MIDQVQLVASQLLDRRAIGRPAQKAGEPLHCADISRLRLRWKLAQPHVVEHALALRADGMSRLGHRTAPVAERGGSPHSSTWKQSHQIPDHHRQISAPLPR